MSDQDKFSRQRVLPEVGDVGQARIERSPLQLPTGVTEETREMATVYARAAGLLLPATQAEPSPATMALEKTFRHPSSRAIGMGAAYALWSVHFALNGK